MFMASFRFISSISEPPNWKQSSFSLTAIYKFGKLKPTHNSRTNGIMHKGLCKLIR